MSLMKQVDVEPEAVDRWDLINFFTRNEEEQKPYPSVTHHPTRFPPRRVL